MRIPARTIVSAAIVAAIAGCAITPQAEQSLAGARDAYQQAQADPHVKQLAPVEFSEAGRALTRAEQLARDNADSEWIEHRAYIAMQRSRIARQTAAMRAAEQTLEKASAERERVLLQARARAAESGQASAEQQAKEAEAARLAAIERSREAAQAAEERADAKLSAELQRLQAQVAELQTQQTDRGMLLRFAADVVFDVGQASLKPGARRTLENIAAILNKEPERRLVIEGFTDNTGNADANQRLSEQRAQAVKAALIQHGIPAENIETRGMGEAYPVASNATATGRQLNRRVEILIPGSQGTATGAGRRPGTGPGTGQLR